MTVIQAAEILGLSPAGVRRRIERGEMKATLVSPRLYLIPADEVERWQKLGKLKPGPKPQESTVQDLRREQADHQDVLEQGRRRIRGERS